MANVKRQLNLYIHGFHSAATTMACVAHRKVGVILPIKGNNGRIDNRRGSSDNENNEPVTILLSGQEVIQSQKGDVNQALEWAIVS